MNKRQGYYELKIKYNKVTGFDSDDNELIKEVELKVRGHFSVNFWAYIEEKYMIQDLKELLASFADGVTMRKFRDMVYFSHMAYCFETGANTKFNSLEECGIICEQMNQSQSAEVTSAFLKSHLISSLVREMEEAMSEGQEEEKKRSY